MIVISYYHLGKLVTVSWIPYLVYNIVVTGRDHQVMNKLDNNQEKIIFKSSDTDINNHVGSFVFQKNPNIIHVGGVYWFYFPTWILGTSEHTDIHCHHFLAPPFLGICHLGVKAGTMVCKLYVEVTNSYEWIPNIWHTYMKWFEWPTKEVINQGF